MRGGGGEQNKTIFAIHTNTFYNSYKYTFYNLEEQRLKIPFKQLVAMWKLFLTFSGFNALNIVQEDFQGLCVKEIQMETD